MQQRNDMYGLENDDKMQTCISWSTSRAVPRSCTSLEMRCDAKNDIHMQVGATADDAASVYAGSTGQAGEHKTPESTSGMSTRVLDFGSTNHMAARDKGFTVKTSGSGAKITLADGHKVSIKGHGYVSMDVGSGNT